MPVFPHDGCRFLPIHNSPGYVVGEDGSVWSSRFGTWRQLSACPNKGGYLHLSPGRGKSRYVHELVLLAFVGPCPPGMQCRHQDGNKANNRLENLCWGTPTQNQADRVTHGTASRGERHALAKLDVKKVLQIRALRKQGLPYSQIAKRFGVCLQNAWLVGEGRTWQHLEEK